MAKANVTPIEYNPVQAPVGDLHFDARNPRLQEYGADESDDSIIEVLWREFAVDEIALSIAANGYFQYEPLFVARENDQLVVIEGNRRLAAVRLLLESPLRRAVGADDLPRITTARRRELQTLPVVEVEREAIWQYVGFKHVNGPQAWDSYSKAQYIAWVHNDLHISLDDIADHIGDKHDTVIRLYRGLMVLKQAEDAGVFSVDDRWKTHFSFSHLYTGISYKGIQDFLKLPPRRITSRPVPERRTKELGELCTWLFGSKTRNRKPLVQTQNPDLRVLDDVLQTPNGVAALRRGLPLGVSHDISRGDDQLFREALVDAKRNLQEARGKLLSGYHGERDLLDEADDIRDLAENVHSEMEIHRKTLASKKRRAVSRARS